MCPYFLQLIKWFSDHLQKIYYIIAIIAASTAALTFYFQFLKLKIRILCGKRSINIWYNINYKRMMFDLHCIFLNEGGRVKVIDYLEIKSNNWPNNIKFTDRLFFKPDKDGKIHLDSFAHPIFMNKLSEKSFLIGFLCSDASFMLPVGTHNLNIFAYSNGKIIDSDSLTFELTSNNVQSLQSLRNSNNPHALEIEILK